MTTNTKTLSYIEPHESALAEELIIKELGFEPPRPCGYQILVKIYTRPEDYKELITETGEKKMLYLPEAYGQQDKWSSCVALVVRLGPTAYKTGHHRRNNSDSTQAGEPLVWCQPGDFVIIPRHEGTMFTYKKVPFMTLPDDRILNVVQDPQDVSRS